MYFFIYFFSPFLHCLVRSEGKTSLGCRAGIWTRACHTAGQRTTNCEIYQRCFVSNLFRVRAARIRIRNDLLRIRLRIRKKVSDPDPQHWREVMVFLQCFGSNIKWNKKLKKVKKSKWEANCLRENINNAASNSKNSVADPDPHKIER